MSNKTQYHLTLLPTNTVLTVDEGAKLRDVLFEQGVEFPCGGQGRCRGCRVRVVKGDLRVSAVQEERLSAKEIADGWRLSCQCAVTQDLTVELRQWDASILANDTPFVFVPREGLGVAVDIGTTTLVAQLLDLCNGRVLAVKTALNPQARYGADVMSRVDAAVTNGQATELKESIRHEVGRMIVRLMDEIGRDPQELRRVCLVGNTVMHHLFCGLELEPLSHYPFEPAYDGLVTMHASALGWKLPEEAVVEFLPCLGGFVGSDILAGIMATGLHESEQLTALIDLGTNGEIVIGNRDRLICASTAAGPAFEGARIQMGMRASTGAIWKVTPTAEGGFQSETLGNTEPKGICGSGLVDAVATGLDLKLVIPGGRIKTEDKELHLGGDVRLTQTDIRQLQLAKGAIWAGVRVLLRKWGAELPDLSRIYLAGAFGNYVNRTSARRIGLIDFPEEQVESSGNTALLGAKMALFSDYGDKGVFQRIRDKVEHITLSSDPLFMEIYVDEMTFPAE